MPRKSLLHHSLCWLCSLVLQRRISLEHRREVHLPPRQQKRAESSCERRTIKMGTTGCHLPSRRIPRNGKSYFTMLSLHINNAHAKKNAETRRTCYLVAGDLNGAAWCCLSGSDARSISSIEEALVNTSLLLPPCHLPPLWGPGGVPGEWSDVCGFLKPPGSDADWQIRNHEAFTIPYSTLGLKETDQRCHREVWMHLLRVNARLVDRVPYDHSMERRQHQ